MNKHRRLNGLLSVCLAALLLLALALLAGRAAEHTD